MDIKRNGIICLWCGNSKCTGTKRQVVLLYCAERDVDMRRWSESNKSTDSDTAGQEGKGASVCPRGREWSCAIQRICISGLPF